MSQFKRSLVKVTKQIGHTIYSIRSAFNSEELQEWKELTQSSLYSDCVALIVNNNVVAIIKEDPCDAGNIRHDYIDCGITQLQFAFFSQLLIEFDNNLNDEIDKIIDQRSEEYDIANSIYLAKQAEQEQELLLDCVSNVNLQISLKHRIAQLKTVFVFNYSSTTYLVNN